MKIKNLFIILFCSCLLFSGCTSSNEVGTDGNINTKNSSTAIGKLHIMSLDEHRKAHKDASEYIANIINNSNAYIDVFNSNPDLITDENQIVSLAGYEDFKKAKDSIFDIHEELMNYDTENLSSEWKDCFDKLLQWSELVKDFYTKLDKGVKGTELVDTVTNFADQQMIIVEEMDVSFQKLQEDLIEMIEASNRQMYSDSGSATSGNSDNCKFTYSSGAVCGAKTNNYVDLCDEHFHELNDIYQDLTN